jgi:hypothetical protein
VCHLFIILSVPKTTDGIETVFKCHSKAIFLFSTPRNNEMHLSKKKRIRIFYFYKLLDGHGKSTIFLSIVPNSLGRAKSGRKQCYNKPNL